MIHKKTKHTWKRRERKENADVFSQLKCTDIYETQGHIYFRKIFIFNHLRFKKLHILHITPLIRLLGDKKFSQQAYWKDLFIRLILFERGPDMSVLLRLQSTVKGNFWLRFGIWLNGSKLLEEIGMGSNHIYKLNLNLNRKPKYRKDIRCQTALFLKTVQSL